MKKLVLLTLVLLVVVSGQVFARNKTVSMQFTENPGNQVFAGGQLIGPYKTDSSNWNSSNTPTTGDKVTGTLVDLIDSSGDATGIDIAWSSSNTWWGADGTADDEHKLAVGYLDDGGTGVSITLTNVPYTNYKIVGLYTSGQGDTATVNADVNGTWALGGDATTTAAVYGSINSCNTNTGSYWTEIDPGVTQGNYWTVDATGATCTVNVELKNGTSRGSLAGIIIESDIEIPPYQRSISHNFQSYQATPDSWGFHWYLSRSSNPSAGYVDPNGYSVLPLQQIPSATWNEGIYKTNTFLAKDEAGSLGSAIAVHTADFEWHTSWYRNITNYFAGSALDLAGDPVALEDGKNRYRAAVGFMGHNGGSPLKPLTSIERVPYGDYMVVTYMHNNHNDSSQQITIEDQSVYYLSQHGGNEFADSVRSDPNDPGWLMATNTVGPATERANVAIFRHLSATDMVLNFDAASNSGIGAYSLVSEVDPEDIATQTVPGNINKNYGDTPAPVLTTLEWNAPANGADSYDVYLGRYNPVDPNADPNFYLVEAGNTTGVYTPAAPLEYNVGYVWKVDTNLGAETISGDYFYFDTEGDPIIQVQPNSVSVKAGSDTFFDVFAILTDNYEWFLSPDAANDTPGDDVSLQSGPDSLLDVLNVTDGVNTGYYYVVCTNNIPGTLAIPSDVASLEIGKLEIYLPFDGDMVDASGNGWETFYGNRDVNDIDPNNPPILTPSMGTISYQTGFDGIGQAAKFTRDSGDQLEVLGSDDYFNYYPKGFTIRMWVKPNDIGGPFVNYISKSQDNWRMYSTGLYYGAGFTAKMSPLSLNTPPGRIDDGNWHMLACTYDGATQEMKVYQEGFLQGTVPGGLNVPVSYPITIGSFYKTGTSGQGYDGLIDDVEIFSYAISELEMLEDYAAKTGEVYCLNERAADLDDDCKVGPSDLAIVAAEWLNTTVVGSTTAGQSSRVVSWQFDETSGNVATDSSGNGIDGTLAAGFTGGQWLVDGGRTGATGDNALYISGSDIVGDPNTSVIATVASPETLPTGNLFLGTAEWTMNIWVRYDAVPITSVNIGGFGQNEWLDPSTNSDRYFASYGGYAGYEVELGQAGLFPSNPIGATWQMLTATYDGTTCVVYYDGVQVSQQDVVLVDTLVNEINLNTARRVLWDSGAVSIKGAVDDFSIWGEAFSAAQVAGMYASSTPSCDGAIASDLDGDCVTTIADFGLFAAEWLECDLVPSSLCD